MRMTFATIRHVRWVLSTLKCICGRYLEPRKRVWWLQNRAISVERNLEIKANVIVSECTVCYCKSLIKLYVIIFYIIFWESFNTQNTELVPALLLRVVTAGLMTDCTPTR